MGRRRMKSVCWNPWVDPLRRRAEPHPPEPGDEHRLRKVLLCDWDKLLFVRLLRRPAPHPAPGSLHAMASAGEVPRCVPAEIRRRAGGAAQPHPELGKAGEQGAPPELRGRCSAAREPLRGGGGGGWERAHPAAPWGR
eukprot:gene84-biopygen11141